VKLSINYVAVSEMIVKVKFIINIKYIVGGEKI